MIWTYKNLHGNVLMEMRKNIEIKKKIGNHFLLNELKNINKYLMWIVIIMLVSLIGMLYLTFKQ